ncbi:hypothetical protein BH10PSE7_BH10PSE7_04670 [soil metagenome]
MGRTGFFTRFASKVARWCGSPLAVALATASIILWAIAGPFFGFSDVWQLTINTGTTIITFLMVFIIQNSQNRDSMAVQIKLDELIRSHHLAHNALLDLEELDQTDLDKFRTHYCKLANEARDAGIDVDAMLAGIQTEKEIVQEVIAERTRSARKSSPRKRKPKKQPAAATSES